MGSQFRGLGRKFISYRNFSSENRTNPLSGSKITAFPRAQVDRPNNKDGDLIRELGNEIKPKDKMDEMLERLLQQQHQDQIDASLKKKGQLWRGLIGGVLGLFYALWTN
ncbi:hypothetical protein MKW98_031372 [Papaver atlanticum]|uniref:Uncharacterized protein n=1 Tax=Papaver atlanticum TaxID=357466 RepID=A0AAD4X8D9_9MAGN|nr:hypothetical protein MKW98_031372 [Papaver atlanticum]